MSDQIASTPDGNGQAAQTSTPVAQPATEPTQTSWYSGLDQDIAGWAENRGLTKMDANAAAVAAAKGHYNAEKYMGVPADKLLRIPDWDKADKVEIDQFFNKMGRPADAKDYQLKVPDGVDPTFSEFAKGMFHEAGLTPRQAATLNEKWNAYVQETIANQGAAYQQEIERQDRALRQEWGHAYEGELKSAQKAAMGLGLKPEQIDALESALGYSGLMKMMNSIGKKIGEDSFVSSGQNNGSFNGAMTPAAAKSRITMLQGDKEWTSKYLGGNVQARAEMEKLMEMAYPT